MALTFPSSATGATAVPTSTSSGLFSGPTTTSNNNNNGSGWFGSGGGGGSTSAYFQTVIISLVALAVLLIISVAFLYYRRRRMRLYSAADWPFHDRSLGGNIFFPGGGAAGGRNKADKDIGEKPEMWEVMLDDEKIGAGSTLGNGAGYGTTMTSEEREMEQEADEKNGSLLRWQPLSIVSLTTQQASVPASSAEQDAGATGTGAGNGGRPTSMFTRGFSSSGLGHAAGMNNNTSGTEPDQTQPSSTTGSIPSSLPIHLTFIIAMPQPPTTEPTQPRPAPTYGYEDEEGEDIPDVELGTTVIDLDLPAEITSPSSSTAPPSYPPPISTGNAPITPNRHTSLGQVLGLTPPHAQNQTDGSGPTNIGGTTTGVLSLRDVLGLPAPVQRSRRERRRERERETIGVR